ncbi:unnamed protein product [Camellia sinensis]
MKVDRGPALGWAIQGLGFLAKEAPLELPGQGWPDNPSGVGISDRRRGVGSWSLDTARCSFSITQDGGPPGVGDQLRWQLAHAHIHNFYVFLQGFLSLVPMCLSSASLCLVSAFYKIIHGDGLTHSDIFVWARPIFCSAHRFTLAARPSPAPRLD